MIDCREQKACISPFVTLLGQTINDIMQSKLCSKMICFAHKINLWFIIEKQILKL